MSNNIFSKLTKNILGIQLTFAWRGHGSSIFLEFGELKKDKGCTHPRGEFSLMLDCDWRVEKPWSILFGSFNGHKRIDNRIVHLIGGVVTKIETIGYLPEVVVSVTPNIRVVSITSYQGQPDWTLFLPDKSWLSCILGKIIHGEAEQRRA